MYTFVLMIAAGELGHFSNYISTVKLCCCKMQMGTGVLYIHNTWKLAKEREKSGFVFGFVRIRIST